ncbi:uncharacterized protein PADG_07149 [Paracoccidioides brasiliensis Pb18]|uniref:Mitotic checkpoint regulator, MAD2B-interacting-domain-containing protein n=1 Tax=Paracoccidioides brasiliensis (strain Pb18) TaxID=502780 RepID=C1GIR3_PARBD|nr:uncharacterized protein PADG_07149 [Paracoccidioides brasiliensis Pb18]EEH42329.1 hypothetical protein PADG_07149 [Paracoccidioides brasiliensis Pb18]
MALVSYSDSEGSDLESTPTTQAPGEKISTLPASSTSTTTKQTFQPLIDRKNPRKILVSLPDVQGDSNTYDDGDGPARKRPRIGAQGGGGAFSGFNSLLPAPKRKGPVIQTGTDKKGDGVAAAHARRISSLKTGAEPGFDRQADAQMRWDLNNNANSGTKEGGREGTSTGSGSGGASGDGITGAFGEKVEEKLAVKSKGNAMMFKPLSVARGTTKKKVKTTVASPSQAISGGGKPASVVESAVTKQQTKVCDPIAKPAQKPKVSLFGLGKEEQPAPIPQVSSSSYEPLVYNAPAGSQPPITTSMASSGSQPFDPPASNQQQQQRQQTLASIADDLNLSRAEKRQLLGRQGASSSNSTGAGHSNHNIITFNTDQEYSSNAAYLLSASEVELAAQQHNPVRAIAPGKHSLQQLVNAVSSQREALEESFATGKRNKKEAGSKYGW